MASPPVSGAVPGLLAGHFSPGPAAHRWSEFLVPSDLVLTIFLLFQAPAVSTLAWHCSNLTLLCVLGLQWPHRTAEQDPGHTQRSTSLLFRSQSPQVACPPSPHTCPVLHVAGLSQGKKLWSEVSGWLVAVSPCVQGSPLSLCCVPAYGPEATNPSGIGGGVTSHSISLPNHRCCRVGLVPAWLV